MKGGIRSDSVLTVCAIITNDCNSGFLGLSRRETPGYSEIE
jgi:hypothetical protein